MRKQVFITFFLPLILIQLFGCSSLPEVKTQPYAKLKNEHTIESEFPIVWKGIEEALRGKKILRRNPENPTPLEMKKLTQRSLETDWINSQSRSKYQDYQVNGFPRKTYLQNRYKYFVESDQVLGGTHVKIKTIEEVERLNPDGTPHGFESVGEADPMLANDLIEKIDTSLKSMAP